MKQELLTELKQYISKYRTVDTDFCSQFDETAMFTYGTTPFETFKTLIDKCKKPSRFVVLGSSIGWQCFYWNSLFPEIPTIGYEIHDIRFDYSCYLAEKYSINNISFFNDDLANAEIQDGDLIWLNNLCIDDEIYNDLIFKSLSRKKNIQIISYVTILQDLQKDNKIIILNNENEFYFFELSKISLPVSWCDDQAFYII